MITRRKFVSTAAAGATLAATAPAYAFEVEPRYRPQEVRIKSELQPQQILILPRAHFLYYITAPGRAIRYGVGVGRAGLEFTGDAIIQVKKEWPTWRPTQEMIERDPGAYGKFKDTDYVQPGGPTNPLGARALYLFQNGRDTFYRIHGTTAPESIGRSVSNGCIRMLNEHVIDLYNRVPIGTPVTVL
ncbi:MAG: L,D-transpeptidase [Rhodobacteraceae bacterium]|jgi:lipoprotein-anchoring transpeptidase ErfK/SrfK|uniref:Twin-arginine translocation pathway signal sequence n=1 Tax=Salipiger profundus TaxID=1229727 RepID=A0A1U7D304_9RHOB|nr:MULTISPECIES: L,D-transpeptidase [Salipiger]APX22529.1 twin-arginine translocation pathway signal sequence [Salipiger profundus]MAB06060.1 L,D-transpeptidase [Paracoccaceae bacterium]GGA11489.1 carnitine operon oxidoreductase caia [Salipiger profundus]SFC70062.1 Tat (twin-arginine translocation) pathway signal sequence [Salipiger profundus]